MKKNDKGAGEVYSLRLDPDRLRRIEDWRAKIRPIPKFTEALRQLIDKGLDVPLTPEEKGKRR